MDFPPVNIIQSVFAGGQSRTSATSSPTQPRGNTENAADTPQGQWVSHVIEVQASRVVHQSEEAIELKPITIEIQPPAHIRRFLEVATPTKNIGTVIDTYV